MRKDPSGMNPTPLEVDVLCVGHACWDLTLMVDHHPRPDEKCRADELVCCGGGPAANAAVAVARLGGTSALIGYLGYDLYGEQHLRELAGEGVRTELLVRGPHPTPLSCILSKPDGQRTVVNYKASTPPLDPSQVSFSRCRPKVILFDGHEPLLSAPLVELAKQWNCATVLDAGSVHPGSLELAPIVDHLVASEKFSRDFTGMDDPREALRVLSKVCSTVVITRGEHGLLWNRGLDEGHVPAFRITAKDTTGAGDTFHGSYALCIAREMAFLPLLRYASGAAALCCTRAAARPGIPTHSQVAELLGKPS
jgi:sulfofructose kinase